MTAQEFVRLAFDRPELLLALALSAPNRAPSERRVVVEISDAGVLVRDPHRRSGRRGDQALLLGSKETIAAAVLLYTVWAERGGVEYERQLMTRVLEFMSSTAEERTAASEIGLAALSLSERSSLHRDLFASLDVGDDYVRRVEARCQESFASLEEDRLIVDPGFLIAPELVVLLGLVPMQWSVRTPQGENIYRRIRLDAPLWTLEIEKRKTGRPRTDWEFHFRGLAFVRNLLRMAAEQYLASEDRSRREQGRPRLRRPTELMLDQAVDEGDER
jgi:hypothetical protein